MSLPPFCRTAARVVAAWAFPFALLLLALPGTGVATPMGRSLSLEQAIDLALARAPLLDARRAQVSAAEQQSRRAGALPDPVLTVAIDNLPVTGSAAFELQADAMTMKRIGLRQQIPARARREAQVTLATRGVDAALARARVEQLDVRRQAAEAWIELWAAQRELNALADVASQAELVSSVARARVAGGAGSSTEALAVAAAALELDNRIEAARAARQAARIGLQRWIGDAAPGEVGEPPDFTRLPVPEARLLAALDRLGPLLPATAEVETAAAAVDLARAQRRPDWSVAASYGQRDGGHSDMFMLEVGIELPLFPGNRQHRGIAAGEAEYAAALAMREDLRRQQVARIRSGIARWEGLKRQLARDRDALLPLTRDRTATALAAYRGGAALGPWLEARRDELGALVDHNQRLAALGRAWAALAYLLPPETQQ